MNTANSKAPPVPPVNQIAPIEEVKNAISKMDEQFTSVLPQHISSAKFIQVVQTAIQTNPNILQADRRSLYSACMRSAQDGLLPDGKEAALVPFRNKQGAAFVTYMPMVAGILKKVRNSGELASITSQIVFEKDTFKYWVDSEGEHVNHEPLMFQDRGAPIGVYALAITKDGAVYVEVLNADQVIDIKNFSKAKDGPWHGPFESEMWRKTALRRLSKRLPMSTDLENVMTADDELFDGPTEPSEPAAPSTKPTKLAQALAEKANAEEIVEAEEITDL